MIKNILSAAVAVVFTVSFAHAEPGPICAEKIERIQEQMEHAKKYGNQYRLRGLQRALEQVTQHCSDEHALSEQEHEVADKQQAVLERQADLDAAQRDNKSDKLAKRQRKLLEAQAELEEEVQTLHRLRALQTDSPE